MEMNSKLKSGILIRTGSISTGNQRFISDVIKTGKYKSVLEIGTHIGVSGEAILSALEGRGERFDTVDIVDVNSKTTKKYEKYHPEVMPFERFKKYSTPHFFHSNGSRAFFATNHNMYDFIFIDGSHKKEDVMFDIFHSFKYLKKGGRILLHDYYPNGEPIFEDRPAITGIYKAVKALQQQGYNIKAYPVGETYPGVKTSFCFIEMEPVE